MKLLHYSDNCAVGFKYQTVTLHGLEKWLKPLVFFMKNNDQT